MNIHSPDQDLLLLTHRELSPWRQAVTQAHVAVCTRCQARLRKMAGASRLMADSIRGQDLPQWPLPAPERIVSAARAATAWRLALVLMVVLGAVTLGQWVSAGHHFGARQPTIPQSQPSEGCRPDLPNDKCR